MGPTPTNGIVALRRQITMGIQSRMARIRASVGRFASAADTSAARLSSSRFVNLIRTRGRTTSRVRSAWNLSFGVRVIGGAIRFFLGFRAIVCKYFVGDQLKLLGNSW